jgi:hypothetical protein|nr:MAG TPA: hypothetical protein [Bacteriophage sp.]
MTKLTFKLIFHLYQQDTNEHTLSIFKKLMDRVLEPSPEHNSNGYRGEKIIKLQISSSSSLDNNTIKKRLELEFNEHYRKLYNIKKGKYQSPSKFMVYDNEKQKYIFCKDIKEILK